MSVNGKLMKNGEFVLFTFAAELPREVGIENSKGHTKAFIKSSTIPLAVGLIIQIEKSI